ncbi:glycosyl hydrolase family 18 protein [Paenibacillus radicibacter]|uniref:glycosyl hydrolase family 18 protein n=1 Tax=Paenibacillus radicibacter TaxID=2972488 RepID=UPI002158F293|nr:glycosyl hydrolase family 18 protein [Paenibacillus radicibacter]
MIKKKGCLSLLFLFLCVAGVVVAAFYYFNREVPSTEHVGIEYYGKTKPVFYKGELSDSDATGSKESLKLPLGFIQKQIDPSAIYEEASQSVIVTTENKVVRLRTKGLTSTINEKPYTLKFPIDKKGEVVNVPIDPLLELYHLDIRESDETGITIVNQGGDSIVWGSVLAKDKETLTVPIRTRSGVTNPILGDLSPQEEVMIWGEENGWYKVQRKNGMLGYVEKQSIQIDHTEKIASKVPPEPYIPWKPVGGKINMTWEHVTSKNPDTSKIPAMPGLNVISPTWFHLADGKGNLNNTADAAYVKWAQNNGLQVWALFDNGFEPKQTTQALATYDTRMKMIKQLLSFAQMYKLQGINIDFENVVTADKQNFVQFVREFTPLAHEQNLVVSVDVTPKSQSEMWSLFLDRRALAQTVDYMMLMGYDEHWATSPKAGSVASLPWVENAIKKILDEDEVPPEKLVLGVPSYTRLWTEEIVDGKTKVSSRAIFMERAQRIISENKLTPVFQPEVGQNYVEYKEGDKLNKIWIEDAVSMKARTEIVKKFNLAGIASWRRGFETPDIWKVIEEGLTKRP